MDIYTFLDGLKKQPTIDPITGKPYGAPDSNAPGYSTPAQRPALTGTGVGDFLGQIPAQPEGGDPQAAAGGGGMRMPPAQQTAPPPAPRKHGGLHDFLGRLGDALLIGSGHPAMYGPHKERERLGEHLTALLGIDDPNFAALMQDDPQTGYNLWQAQHPKGEAFTLGANQVRYGPDGKEIAHGPADAGNDPVFIQELQRLGIDPHSDLALEIFGLKNSPGGQVAHFHRGGQAPAQAGGVSEGATATNPKTGEKIQYKGGQWVPMGGGAGNGTGGFPGH